MEPLPSYLSNPVALIRILKSSSDPPQLPSDSSSSSSSSPVSATTRRKIDIVLHAWNDPRCQIWKKEEIIGEWVVDSLVKAGAAGGSEEISLKKTGKGKAKDVLAGEKILSPILDERYYNLLTAMTSAYSAKSTIASTPLPQLITSLFNALRLQLLPSISATSTSTNSGFTSSQIESLLLAAHKCFTSIQFSRSSDKSRVATSLPAGEKAEDWLEALGGLLSCWTVSVEMERNTGEETSFAAAYEGILLMVKKGLEDGLKASLVRKKITLTNLKEHVSTLVLTYGTSSPFQATIGSLLPNLFFPLEILQAWPITPNAVTTTTAWTGIIDALFSPLLKPKTPSQSPSNFSQSFATFLPHLFQAYISSLKTHRYALFTSSHSQPKTKGGAGGEVPLDVWVMSKVREGVMIGCRGSLDLIEKMNGSSDEDSEGSRWRAMKGIWNSVKQAGAYFEGEAGWRELVQRTTGLIELKLEGEEDWIGIGEEKERKAVAVAVVDLVDILVGLDYEGVFGTGGDLGSRILGWSLALPAEVEHQAISLLLSILRFHTLTQNIPAFFTLLTNTMTKTIKSSAHPAAKYDLIATGSFTSPMFLEALQQGIDGSFVGGISEERGWGLCVIELGKAMEKLANGFSAAQGDETMSVTDEATPAKKKRKVKAGALDGVDSVGLHDGAIYALLSRLLYSGLIAARGKGKDVELDGTSSEVLNIVHKVSSSWSSIQGGDSWQGRLVMAGRNRLGRAAAELGTSPLRFVKQNGKKRKREQETGEDEFEMIENALHGAVLPDPSAFDQALEQLQSAGTGSDAYWNGRVAGVKKESLGPAVWTLLSVQGLGLLEEQGTAEQIRRMGQIILTQVQDGFSLLPDLTNKPYVQLSVDAAIQRMLSTASFWELTKIRAAILELAGEDHVSQRADSKAGIFLFFTIAPVEYIPKSIRTALCKEAGDLAMQSKSSDPIRPGSQAIFTQFMLKMAKECDYLGSIDHATVACAPHSNETEKRAASNASAFLLKLQRDLRSEYLRIVLSDLKIEKRLAIWDESVASLCGSEKRTQSESLDYMDLAVQLLEAWTASKVSSTALPGRSLKFFKKFIAVSWQTIESLLLVREDLDAKSTATLLKSCYLLLGLEEACLDPSVDHRTPVKAFWRHTYQAIVAPRSGAQDHDMTIANDLMQLLLALEKPQSTITGAERWLAAWMALRIATNPGAASALDQHFLTVLPAFSIDSYGTIFSLLLEQLNLPLRSISVPGGGSFTRTSLIALGLLLQAVVPGTGKISRASVPVLLSGLDRLLEMGGVEMMDGVMAVSAVIAKEKAASLVSQDVSALLGLAIRSLRPSQMADTRQKQFSSSVFTSIITITSSLVRQRRDLIVDLLPLLVTVHSRLIPLFSLPRRTGEGASRAQKRVLESWPIWLTSVDSEHWLGKEEAREFARALTGMTSRTTIRTMAESNPASNINTSGTMVGELSKHAPAILVSYTRALASPYSSVPLEVRRELEPGLFALCEAVTSGGKALFGIKGGESSGDAFGLGEGGNTDAEWEVWGDLWRRWRGRRYTGGG